MSLLNTCWDCVFNWWSQPEHITQTLIIGTAVIWIIYDFWVYNRYGAYATISDVMRGWGYDMPWLLVVWGALCWHFWGETPSNR